MIMMTIVQRYMGISAALLLIIPLVIIVRILVKKSRWSVLKISHISMTGAAVLALWLHFAESATGAEACAWIAKKIL